MSYQTQTIEEAKWYPFTASLVNLAPKLGGVYWLGIANNTIIYIGRSGDLRQRLLQHKDTIDPSLRQASIFAFARHPNPERRERELLADYASKNNGRLPRCNDRLG